MKSSVLRPRLGTLLALLLVLALPGAGTAQQPLVGAAPDGVTTTRVKVQKGVIDDVALAHDPDTGNLLAVYESDGRILATVLKPKGGNDKYKGRKAKLISGQQRIHHRPSAAWYSDSGVWVVAWDTGPADLAEAATARRAGRAAEETSQIRTRSLRARNGKPVGAEGIVEAEGELLVSPHLVPQQDGSRGRVAPEGFAVFTSGPSGGPARISEAPIIDPFAGPGPPEILGMINGQPPFALLGPPLVVDGTGCLTTTSIFGDGNQTVRVHAANGGFMEVGGVVPAHYSDFVTFGGGLVPVNGVPHLLWGEPTGCFLQRVVKRVDAPLQQVHDVPGAMNCNALQTWVYDPPNGYDRRHAAAEPAVLGLVERGRLVDGVLFPVDPDAGVGAGRTVFTTKKGVLAKVGARTADGTVFVLWAEERNKKKSKLWLEVIQPE